MGSKFLLMTTNLSATDFASQTKYELGYLKQALLVGQAVEERYVLDGEFQKPPQLIYLRDLDVLSSLSASEFFLKASSSEADFSDELFEQFSDSC